MIEALFVLHVVVLFLLYRLVEEKAGRIIALFYTTYLSAFTVLKPALLYYFGLYFPYSTNKPSAVAAELLGSLIFLVIQYGGIKLLADLPPPKFAVRLFDFDEATPGGIAFAFIVLMIVSYVGCTIKFHDPLYMFKYVDAFAAEMAQANGSYYINIVSDILLMGFLMFVSYTYWRMPAGRSLVYTLALLVLTFLWTKLANRTTLLVAILAWTVCVIPIQRQKRINIFALATLGYALLMVLYVVNYIRLGNVDALGSRNPLVSAVYNAAVDMAPVDNSVMLYNDLTNHDLMYFQYLAGSITPMVLVPSAIFPFKPRVDKDSALTDLYFPNGADTTYYHEGSTLTFTIPGSGYADAYYFGVVVASLLYVGLFCWYLWIYRRGTKSARFIAAFCMMAHIAGYRLSVESLFFSFYTFLSMIGLTHYLALVPTGAGDEREGARALTSGDPS